MIVLRHTGSLPSALQATATQCHKLQNTLYNHEEIRAWISITQILTGSEKTYESRPVDAVTGKMTA